MKKALITGINGSGATYLAEYLSSIPSIQIQGISRWHTDRKNKSGIFSKIEMFECDLTDLGSIIRTLEIAQPDYIFHLASNANVKLSFTTPISVFNNNVNGTLNLLEALRILNQKPMIQFCGTSEVYGQVREDEIPINNTNSLVENGVFLLNNKPYTHKYNINNNDLNYLKGKKYKNIFEMRKLKNDYLMNIMPTKVKNYLLINYEDLLYNFEKTLLHIKTNFCLVQTKEKFENIKKYKKSETYDFVKQRLVTFPENVIKLIWMNLDKKQEAALGYLMGMQNKYFIDSTNK
jgi:hypothetical protein